MTFASHVRCRLERRSERSVTPFPRFRPPRPAMLVGGASMRRRLQRRAGAPCFLKNIMRAFRGFAPGPRARICRRYDG